MRLWWNFVYPSHAIHASCLFLPFSFSPLFVVSHHFSNTSLLLSLFNAAVYEAKPLKMRMFNLFADLSQCQGVLEPPVTPTRKPRLLLWQFVSFTHSSCSEKLTWSLFIFYSQSQSSNCIKENDLWGRKEGSNTQKVIKSN